MKLKFKAAAAVFLALMMTGCANDHYTKDGGEITTSVIKELPPEETATATAEVTEIIPEETTEETEAVPLMITDREGNDIFVPDSVNTIISISPTVTELLEGLNIADRIIAADKASAVVENIDAAVCTIDRATVTAEELAAMGADVVIADGTSSSETNAQLAVLKEMGIKVLFIPYSNSFSSIKLDIEFLAAYTGTVPRGDELIKQIDEVLLEPSALSYSVPLKNVYFETSPAPSMQAAGSGTLFAEMLTLIGAGNICASQTGYISPESADIISADPDVIISNVHSTGYDTGEIAKRQGWRNIKAVKNGAVFSTASSIRPTHRITEYIQNLKELVYPEIYAVS